MPVRLSQRGAGEPPMLGLVRRGDTPLFEVGHGATFVYRADTTHSSRWHEIVRHHEDGGTVVLDCSYEGYAFETADVHAIIEAAQHRSVRVIVATQNAEYVRAVRRLDDDRLRAVFLHCFLPTIERGFGAVRSHDWLFRKYLEDRAPTAGKERRFTCLLNRARPHRVVIFGWLKERGYLDHGAVSFHGGETDFHAAIDQARRSFPAFSSAIDAAASTTLPFMNFDRTSSENFITSVNIPPYRMSPVSLVAESEMTHGSIQRYTEKSLKALLAGHRVLIAGNPGVHKQLRAIGFNLPGFDLALDAEALPSVRLSAVLAEFDRYMTMADSERVDWIEATWLACRENVVAFAEHSEGVMQQSWRALAEAVL